MTSILTDADIAIEPILNKNVTIIGYGNQGRPQALNLRDSGVTVKIGARAEGNKRELAEKDGFEVLTPGEAVAWADVLMLLVPDQAMESVYENVVKPNMRAGQYLGFGHGLAITAGWIRPDPKLNVFMVAPKGQGRGVRSKYLAGSGVPGFYAVQQNPSSDTHQIARAYARAIGCGRVGVFDTTFAEEAECDLFTEQTVLCGGLTSLIKAAFEVLTEAGYSPETAYFECMYEVKLIADLLHERGITGMRQAISPTALFGDVTRGRRVIDEHVKENMRQVLSEIRSGQFAKEMKTEFEAGRPVIRQRLDADYHHGIEGVHRRLRDYLNRQPS